jgi:hypothetical protein
MTSILSHMTVIPVEKIDYNGRSWHGSIFARLWVKLAEPLMSG